VFPPKGRGVQHDRRPHLSGPAERRGYFSEYPCGTLGATGFRCVPAATDCATSRRQHCTSGIERFVWAGDNILWELRGPGANTETADRLALEYAVGQEYGIVGYTQAGGVDRPLVAYKTMGGNAGAVVVPHMNWRGLFSTGTNAAGGARACDNAELGANLGGRPRSSACDGQGRWGSNLAQIRSRVPG
jgi:hypothetical protein